MNPTPVTIVRPTITPAEGFWRFISVPLNFAFAGWIICGISSELGHPLSYWHAVLVVIGVRTLIGNPSAYAIWTKAGN